MSFTALPRLHKQHVTFSMCHGHATGTLNFDCCDSPQIWPLCNGVDVSKDTDSQAACTCGTSWSGFLPIVLDMVQKLATQYTQNNPQFNLQCAGPT